MEVLSKPWLGTSATILEKLETSTEGLSEIEAQKRLFKFGSNSISQYTPIPLLQIFLDQFLDLLVLMLIFAGLLSFLLGDTRNGIIISIIVLVNGIIGFSQEYKAQRILKALNKLLPEMVKVKRNGKEKQISAEYIVVGDIVLLGPGNKIPSDIRLIESYDLRVDEKTLTGEAQPQAKNLNAEEEGVVLAEVKNTVFMGTVVVDGEALGVVTAVGLASEFGKIAQKTTEIKKTLSPLQEKTQKMSKRVAILAAFIVLGLVIYKYFIDRDILDALIFSVAVAAALVPEGLPATISVALSLGARKLAKHHALVRNLVSVETLGSVTAICTDKTGTLTTGQMRVEQIWSDLNLEIKSSEKQRLILENFVLCNDSQIGEETFGDPLEIALLHWAKKEGANFEEIQQKYRKVAETPFNSSIRYMSVTLNSNGYNFSYLKGAPEVLVEKCTLNNKEKEQILKKVDDFALKGYRVLAFAYNQIFLGLASIYDPPRKEVKNAIEECRKGHIRILMVTGDNPTTARAIAQMTGVTLEKQPQIILGDEIDQMTDTKLKNILLGEPIFARVMPEHKFRIVDSLMKMGEIVAVTGDGVNDAPALKRADIGIAMGINGTDVSREAADMVLLDDNFATIVQAIKEGRAIFDNIKKFLFYIFSSNFGELLTVICGVAIGLPLPITAVQILSVDLGTDVLPSMALIFEPPEHQIMHTKPRSKEVQLLSGESFLHLTLIGFVMSIGAVWNFLLVQNITNNYVAATTTALATLVVAQSFNAFLSRCPDISIFKYPFWRNGYLLLAEIFSYGLILAIIYLTPFNHFIVSSHIPLNVWPRIFLVGIVLLIFEEVYKLVKKHYTVA